MTDTKGIEGGVDTSTPRVEQLASSLTLSFPNADFGGVDVAVSMGEHGVDALVLLDAQATLRTLAAKRDELQASFKLRWDADMRAIARWRAAHPGKELMWPAHADLVVWLLEQLVGAERDIEVLNKGISSALAEIADAGPKALKYAAQELTTARAAIQIRSTGDGA